MSKSKYIPPKNPPVNLSASIRKIKYSVKEWNAKPHRTRKEKIKNSHLQSMIYLLIDFVHNMERGRTRNGAWKLTLSNLSLRHEQTQTDRTSYNHIDKLLSVNFLKGKRKTRHNFGKGTLFCIELIFNTKVVLFYDEELNKLIAESGDKKVENPMNYIFTDKSTIGKSANLSP